MTTPDVEDIVVTGRTKSGGVLTLKSLPGWEAQLRDQGHGNGFLIRVQAGGSALAARVERTMPGTRWAQACELAGLLLHAVAEGEPAPIGLSSPRDDKPQRTNGVRSTTARKKATAARTPAVVDPVQSLLPTLDWPSPELFPHNAHGNSVARVLLPDLLGSLAPLIITGYSSLDTLVPLLAQLAQRVPKVDQIRLLLGTEPHPSKRTFFPLSRAAALEIGDYWRNRGISVALCGQVLAAVELLESGVLHARTSNAQDRLIHGKLYVTERSAMVGSSNFSHPGLGGQHETNVRFAPEHAPFFGGAHQLAERLWEVGTDYSQDLLELLRTLLQSVTWQEALARACAEVLEGTWANKYVGTPGGDAPPFWPSQRQGIAQALWVLEHVGSIHSVRRARRAGLGKVFNALLDLHRPDPAAEVLALLGVDASVARKRFAEFDQDLQP